LTVQVLFVQAYQLADAVAVGLDVLRCFPEYPRIEADIIAPAASRLRRGSERDERARLGLPPTVRATT
jgi:hypothetical protein